jgi:hypothetical protein
MSDVIEVSEERVAKILRLFKETIVCDVLASVIPDAFCRIQLRPVGRKLEHFDVATVGFEPVVGFLFGCGSFRFSYFCEIQGQLAGARSVTTPLFS